MNPQNPKSKSIGAHEPDGKISRRDFGQKVALATATTALVPGEVLSKTPPQAPGENAALSAASQTEVELKIQAILKKYGNRLNEAQQKDIRRLVAEGQKALERLRAFPLENSNQPATALKLYPEAVNSISHL